MMNYSAPTASAMITATKYFGRLLLPLLFSTALISCDNRPSTTVANNETADEQLYEAVQSDDEVSGENEGESLIAAAKPNDPDNNVPQRRATMFSESINDSALQATLIGDYVGVLPCSFCSGISIALNLFADGSVIKTSIYQNPETPTLPLSESGVYRQDNMMITIVYDNKNIESYAIEDNHLVMVTDDHTLDHDYTLSRK